MHSRLALKQKALPADHPDIGQSWNGIANVEIELGDYAAALQADDQVLSILQPAYGTDSPLLALPLGNRGEVLDHLGRHEEAERDLRSSIEGWIVQVGPDHPWVAYPLTALGKTLSAEARPKQAVPFANTVAP
jgi:tetratricopeptide (TPR) repeat protein